MIKINQKKLEKILKNTFSEILGNYSSLEEIKKEEHKEYIINLFTYNITNAELAERTDKEFRNRYKKTKFSDSTFHSYLT